MYYPVDIYFVRLFGFDGLELSFFQKILMQVRGKEERPRKKKKSSRDEMKGREEGAERKNCR